MAVEFFKPTLTSFALEVSSRSLESLQLFASKIKADHFLKERFFFEGEPVLNEADKVYYWKGEVKTAREDSKYYKPWFKVETYQSSDWAQNHSAVGVYIRAYKMVSEQKDHTLLVAAVGALRNVFNGYIRPGYHAVLQEDRFVFTAKVNDPKY